MTNKHRAAYCRGGRGQIGTIGAGARGFLYFVGAVLRAALASRLAASACILSRRGGSHLLATLSARFVACRLRIVREFEGNSRSHGDKTRLHFVSFCRSSGTKEVLTQRSLRSRRGKNLTQGRQGAKAAWRARAAEGDRIATLKIIVFLRRGQVSTEGVRFFRGCIGQQITGVFGDDVRAQCERRLAPARQRETIHPLVSNS